MMAGKRCIAVFLVLYFTWQVSDGFTCTASGRYADPADTTCKNYIMCVARLDGNFTGHASTCPFTSMFSPIMAQCTTNYVCNVSIQPTSCIIEGFFEDPSSTNCSTYIQCIDIDGAFVQITLTCPTDTFYNPVTTLCEVSYICTFTCAAAGRYPNSADRACKTYYMCIVQTNGTITKYAYTCPTKSVFSPYTRVCTTSYACPTS